jgi:hypothetical protein
MYFIFVYENRIMKPNEAVLKRVEGGGRMIDGMNLIKIYFKHIVNFTMYPLCNYYMQIKIIF